MILLTIALSALPSAGFMFYFYRQDRYRREPVPLLLVVFAAGFFMLIPAAFAGFSIQYFFSLAGIKPGPVISAFILAGAVEEFFKLMTVRLTVWRSPFFDEVSDGIIYTIAASLGFAFFENILYSLDNPLIIITRAFTAVPLHAAASGIMGWFLGRSKIYGEKVIFKGWLAAVLLHGCYNWLLFTQSLPAVLVLPLLYFSMKKLIKLYKNSIIKDNEKNSL